MGDVTPTILCTKPPPHFFRVVEKIGEPGDEASNKKHQQEMYLVRELKSDISGMEKNLVVALISRPCRCIDKLPMKVIN